MTIQKSKEKSEKRNLKTGCDGILREPPSSYMADDREYTIEDIYALPEGVRAELLDGKLYFMAAPTRTHQRIGGEMHLAVASHIRARGGSCEVYIPPFGVFLNGDDSTFVEPDLTVVCDTSKLEEKGCIGAPDWVVEVVSPSSARLDAGLKLRKYRDAGVREVWIIYPEKRSVAVYIYADRLEKSITLYSFEDSIPCEVIPDLKIRLADHL